MQRLERNLGLSYIDECKEKLEKPKHEHNACRSFEIWALGIAIVIGGDYFSWNAGIFSGFGCFLLATLLIGSAYISLILCTSEMVSALPFAGGAYGLARCTLGFFPGFLVGSSEALEYITYVSISVLTLVSMISSFLGTDSKYHPVYCLVFYLVSNGIHIYGGGVFWKFSNFIGVVSILVVVVYCLGALAWVDFQTNVTDSQPFFRGGIAGFFRILPLPAWFYVGVESLAFTCDLVHQGDPKVIVPRGSILCSITLFASSIWVLFVCCSLPPGTHQIAAEQVPLNAGFALIFKCSSTFATILSIPATFATAHGFIFSYGKLLYALAGSRLLPSFLHKTTESQGTPYAAIICGSCLSYGVCLLVFFVPELSSYLFNICILCAFVAYCTQCIGYCFMKTKYSRIKRLFKSPLGIVGSLYAFIVFFVGIIAVIGFQEDNHIAFISTTIIWGLLSAYYFSYSKYRQIFSAEEQKILLVAHVINHNLRRTASQRRNQKRLIKVRKEGSSFMSSETGGQLSAIEMNASEVDVHAKRFAPCKCSVIFLKKKSTVKCINVRPTCQNKNS